MIGHEKARAGRDVLETFDADLHSHGPHCKHDSADAHAIDQIGVADREGIEQERWAKQKRVESEENGDE